MKNCQKLLKIAEYLTKSRGENEENTEAVEIDNRNEM